MGKDRPPGEGQDEGEQIKRQRDYPKKRDGRDVGRQVRREAQHQARRDERKENPVQHTVPSGGESHSSVGGERTEPAVVAPRALQTSQHAGQSQHGEQSITHGPGTALLGEAQIRLNDDGVGQQGEHAAQVARPVQEIGVRRCRVARVTEPSLQEWGGSRNHEERQTHYREQKPEEPPCRIRLRRQRPNRIRGNAEGQNEER